MEEGVGGTGGVGGVNVVALLQLWFRLIMTTCRNSYLAWWISASARGAQLGRDETKQSKDPGVITRGGTRRDVSKRCL